jgi:hypothetical protein
MVLYLLSDESKHVTGAEMVVDNGDTGYLTQLASETRGIPDAYHRHGAHQY